MGDAGEAVNGGGRVHVFNDPWVEAYARWLIRNRWLVLALLVVFGVAVASGGRFLTFSNDYRVFFSKENPQLAAFEALQRIYTKEDNILVVVKPRTGDIFTPETLGVVRAMSKQAWQTPFSTRVDSLSTFQHSSADGDDLLVEDLIGAGNPLDAPAIDRIRSIALSDPLLVDRAVNRAGTATGIAITLTLPQQEQDEVPRAVGFVRAMVGDFAAEHPDIRFAVTGNTTMSNAFFEASQADLRTLVPLMYLILIIAMLGFLRSVSGTAGTVVVIGFSAAAAMGLGGWLGVQMTPPSATAPTIILTLAVADSIHILSTMLSEMRRGRAKREAIVEAMRINMDPVFLTSVTTAIGFLSMNFSDVPPLRDLGNLTAAGVMFAWLYSVVLLPALMAILPVRVRARASGRGPLEAMMHGLAELVIRRRTRLLVGMSLLVAVLVAMIPRIELNDDFVNYFDTSIRFRTDTDFAMRELTGIFQFHYSLPAAEGGAISDPDYLARLDAFAEWYRAQPGVVHANSLSDIMRRLNKNMHGDDEAHYRLPEDRELAAQYLLLYELSLPYGLDLNNQVNIDKSATRLIVTMENMTTQELRRLAAEASQWLGENFPSARGSEASGPAVMFAYISGRNIERMLNGTLLAILLISATLILAFRDLKHGLISLIPNLLPALMAFGVWALVVGEIGVAASVVGAASLGIIVDFTVHFLSKYLRARREQRLKAEDAVRYAFATVGVALTVTSAVLIAGFAVLAFSAFLPNEVMGIMIALTIFCALVADFLLLPPLLIAVDRRRSGAVAAPTEEHGHA